MNLSKSQIGSDFETDGCLIWRSKRAILTVNRGWLYGRNAAEITTVKLRLKQIYFIKVQFPTRTRIRKDFTSEVGYGGISLKTFK